jgi:hypothetical protein
MQQEIIDMEGNIKALMDQVNSLTAKRTEGIENCLSRLDQFQFLIENASKKEEQPLPNFSTSTAKARQQAFDVIEVARLGVFSYFKRKRSGEQRFVLGTAILLSTVFSYFVSLFFQDCGRQRRRTLYNDYQLTRLYFPTFHRSSHCLLRV